MVQKTIKHQVVTLEYGRLIAVETVRYCEKDCIQPDGSYVIKRSEFLRSLVKHHGIYGYDIEVYVGLQRYIHFRQIDEIISSLKEEYGISISTGEISILSRRFLKHLSLLHLKKADVIRNRLIEDGGYPLHIDATVEQGKGTLFVAYAGWRKWVLGAWKVSGEKGELLTPCLERIEELFGTPCSIVRDLGRGMTLATANFVEERELEIPVLACHLHFLRDVGKDMLNDSYDKLRKLFRSSSIKPKLNTFVRNLNRDKDIKIDIKEWLLKENYQFPKGMVGKKLILTLCQWIQDYQNESASGNFPFERPYLELYYRCNTISSVIDNFLKQNQQDKNNSKLLKKLSHILDPVRSNSNFTQVAHDLTEKAVLFDDLRNTLRLESELCCDNNTNETIESLNEIKVSFDKYVSSLPKLKEKVHSSLKGSIDIIMEHLNRHGEYLWGHAIQINNQNEVSIRLVERTNNLLESFFHKLKHDERRRSGRKILTCDLELYPASATLVANLKKDDYVKAICGSLDNLPKIFSELDASIDHKINEIDNLDDPLETYKLETSDNKSFSKNRKIVRSKGLSKLIECMS